MARERRIDGPLRRLRRRGEASDSDSGSAGPTEAESAQDPRSNEQLSLGDLNEGRREAVMSKLRGMRDRAPARPTLRRDRADTQPSGLRARTAAVGTGSGKKAPPPPPPPSSAGSSPSGLRTRASALAGGAGDRISAAGSSVAQRWEGIPKIARQRIAAGALVVAVVAVVVWVLIPAAPCGAPGGSTCPAEDRAISLVPDDAIAYAHVDIDPDGEQLDAATAYASRLPLLGGLALGSASEVGGKPVNFASQIEPWAGDEAAVAVLQQAESPTVTMIEADDDDGAREFAEGLIGPTTSEDVGGVAVAVGQDGKAAALLDGFLLIGGEFAVKDMIEREGGSLETAAVAAGIDDLPEDRFAYGYVSGDGARALISGNRQLSVLDTFVNSRSTSAITASLSFEGGRADLTLRSEQDPELVARNPGFFSALPQFKPELDSDVGSDALAYLGLGDPSSSVDSLLSRAQVNAPALAAAYDDADQDLQKAGGVSITDDLLPLLGTEAALSVEPVAGEEAPATPGVLAPFGVPYVSLLADGVDSKAAAQDLADLQQPLTEALVGKGEEVAGQVAVFEPLQIAGTEAQSLNVSSNVELTYATYDNRLVVATKPVGVAQARDGGDGLGQSADYKGVTAGMPTDVSMIAYFDLRDLLELGEQVGLAADPAYARLAPDLRSLQAAAIAVDDTGEQVRTDINLSIGEPAAVESEAAPAGAE